MYIKYDYLTKEQRSAYESLKDSLRSNPIEVPKKLRDRLEEINRFLEAKGVALLKRSFETSYGTITNFLDTEGNKLEVLYQKKGNP